jgi:hypothetical protein
MLRKTLVSAWLIAAAIGVACAQSSPKQGVAGHDGSADAQASAKPQNEQHPASKVTENVNPPNPPADDAEKEQRAEDIRIQWRIAKFTRWLAYIGVIQAIVFLLTLFAIFWQGRTMKEHAGELKKLASAAKGNTDAIIDSERAWLVVDMLPVDHREIYDLDATPHTHAILLSFRFKNSGRTAAKFLSGRIRPHIVKTIDPQVTEIVPDLPTPQVIPEFDKLVFEPGKVWPPDQEWPGSYVLPKDFIRENHTALKTGDKALCVYGLIRYEDSFGKEHETRFGYVYQFRVVGSGLFDAKTGEPIVKPGFSPIMSEEYNRST